MHRSSLKSLSSMNCNRIFVALSLLLLAAASPTAFSQAWKSGRTKLNSGDYRGAEAELTKSYRSAKNQSERAEVLKSLGVAQYMQAKKPQAAASFKNALKMNPALKISAQEVADESVIPFFNQQRSSNNAQVKIPGQRDGSKKPGVTAAKSIRTLVKIVSNVQNAQVSIDGIAYGSAGSDIEVTPGSIVLEISSPGYITKAIKINVAPKTSNTVTVDLQKPRPKPLPVVKALPLPSTKGKLADSRNLKNAKSPGQGKTSLFDSEDSMVSADPYGQSLGGDPGYQQQPVIPPPAPQAPMLPPGAYSAPMQAYPYQPQPQYAYPAPHPQPYMQPIYPQPSYPPPYQQPVYPQSPSVYSPYSGYPQAPVADPFAAAPPPPPEFSSQSVPEPSPPVIEESIGKPPPMKPPKDMYSSSKTKKSKKPAAKSGGCNFLVQIMPLGIGQFCQGSMFKGTIFAGAQIGALFFYKQNTDAATTYQSQLTEMKEQRLIERESYAGDDQIAYDEETVKKEEEALEAINKARSNATTSIAVFGGAWAIGALDAIIFTPKKTVKHSKKTRFSLLLPSKYDRSSILAMVSPFNMSDNLDQSWYIGYTPKELDDGPRGGAIKLGLLWEL